VAWITREEGRGSRRAFHRSGLGGKKGGHASEEGEGTRNRIGWSQILIGKKKRRGRFFEGGRARIVLLEIAAREKKMIIHPPQKRRRRGALLALQIGKKRFTPAG